MTAEKLRELVQRINTIIGTLSRLTLPDPFEGMVSQLASVWLQVALEINRRVNAGNITGALDLLVTSWSQISHALRILRPEAIAGRIPGIILDEIEPIANQVKDALNTLWWLGIILGVGTIGGGAALAYYAHRKGVLIPTIKKAAMLHPAGRAAMMVQSPVQGLGQGPRECRFVASDPETTTTAHRFKIYPTTGTGWDYAVSHARRQSGSVFLSCPDGAIKMVRCWGDKCYAARGAHGEPAIEVGTE